MTGLWYRSSRARRARRHCRINPEQEFVGTYKDSSGKQHGFLQLPDRSAPITVDYPGAVDTIAMGHLIPAES